jgi:hypothetical protein
MTKGHGSRNPGPDSAVAREILNRYKGAHWGIPPTKLVKVPDADTGGVKGVVQMGPLERIHIKEKLRGPGAEFDLDFRKFDPQCHLAFKPRGSQRLYNVLTPEAREVIRRDVWQSDPDAPRYLLSELAKFAPGRQNRYPYPRIVVQCLGWAIWVEYFTDKRETEATKGWGGEAVYRHKCGEDSGRRPLIGVSADGRLWWVGGAYKVPNGGIED